MAFKFVVLVALLAVANAGFLPGAQVYSAGPVAHVEHQYAAQPVLTKTDEEYDPHPQYRFGYNVQDNHSGDSKSQVEERDGDVVRGEYSLIDADGYKRTVKYTADDHNGFNAVVEREPLAKNVAAASIAVKSVAPATHYATPTVVKTVSPVAHYTAPVAHYTAPGIVKTAAPVAHYAPAAVVKAVEPVAHYNVPVAHYNAPAVVQTHYASPAHYSGPTYATYSAPAHYVAHH